jgi:hypothetical protein
MTSTITVGGQSVTLVAMPSWPAARMVEFEINDTVGSVTSEFTKQMQAQEWVGGDFITCTLTLPPLTAAQAGAWKAFMMQLRGIRNAFQLGDPKAKTPQGSARGVPLVNGAHVAGAQVLNLKGWNASQGRTLLPYDALQIGYRLHYVLDTMAADGSGDMAVPIWPSLREAVADGTAVVLNHPKALFRLAKNQRGWSDDITRLSRISLQLVEFR